MFQNSLRRAGWSTGFSLPGRRKRDGSLKAVHQPARRFLLLLCIGWALDSSASDRPNVITLLVDDLGYRDLGCYAGPVKTPVLDKLAAAGVRFTDFHSGAPTCSPSRATFLTGRQNPRTGVYSVLDERFHRMHLLESETTIAEMLKESGYATAHFGKWHLGMPVQNRENPTPGDHGFDYWFGVVNGPGPSHKDPTNFQRNGKRVGTIKGYSCQIVVDEALTWLAEKRDGDEPFFLNLWFNEPHDPIAAPDEIVSQYGALDDQAAIYSGTIDNTDRAIGRLVARLEKLGELDNTIIIYSSDNGSYLQERNGELRGKKGALFEGGHRVPGIFYWKGGIPGGRVEDEPAGAVDLLPTLCGLIGIDKPEGVHLDGSDLAPLLTGTGTFERHQPLFWMSEANMVMRVGNHTLFASSTAKSPIDFKAADRLIEQIKEVLGDDLEKELGGMVLRSRLFNGNFANPEANRLRAEHRKLYYFQESWIPELKKSGLGPVQLYDLSNDLGQQNNIALKHPELAARLKEQAAAIYRSVMAEAPEWPAPEGQAAAKKPQEESPTRPATGASDTDTAKLLTRIDQNPLPERYHGSRHQAYVDRVMADLKPDQRARVGKLWKEKRRLDSDMPNPGASFVRILTYVAGEEEKSKQSPPPQRSKSPLQRSKSPQRSSPPPQRPNVIFLSVDDLNDWVGCLGGHPQAKTPNIDRLAEQGVLFEQTYCAAPLCNPSRTAVMTGLRPSTTGIHGNKEWFRDLPRYKDWVTLPQYFRKHGYAAWGGGKIFHMRDGRFSDPASWDRQYATEVKVAWPPIAKRYQHGLKEKFSNPVLARLIDWGAIGQSKEETQDWKTAEGAAAILRQQHDQPFFLACGIFLPHLPWYAPKEYFDMHPLEGIKLPPHIADDFDDIPEPGLRMLGDAGGILRESGKWKEAVQACLASGSFADACVGHVLDALERSPYRDNTIVVLWGDHGYDIGKKKLAKSALWEQTTRTPMIIHVPDALSGKASEGKVCRKPVSLVDLYPTLIDLCGLPERKDLDGRSLAPLVTDPETEWPWPAIISHSPQWHGPSHAVRTEAYHFISYKDGSAELYDTVRDPYQWNNLAEDLTYKPTVNELRKWIPKHTAPYDKAVEDAPAKPLRTSVLPLLEASCMDCHDADTKTPLNMEALAYDLNDPKSFHQWENVYDAIASGAMPPKKKKRPDAALMSTARTALSQHLAEASKARQVAFGRVPARRMTRSEYEYALHDIFDIKTPLADLLPPESEAEAFDTMASGQEMAPLHIRSYLESADAALDDIIELGPRPSIEPRAIDYRNHSYMQMWFERPLRRGGNVVKRTEDAFVTYDLRPHATQSNHLGMHFKVPGLYRITAEAFGYQAKTPVTFCLYRCNEEEGRRDLIVTEQLTPGKTHHVTWTRYFRPGDYFYIAPADHDWGPSRKPVFAVGAKVYDGEGLGIKSFKIQGPLEPEWPPTRTRALLGEVNYVQTANGYRVELPGAPRAQITDTVRRFGPRLFRRELSDAEVESWVRLADAPLAAGRGFVPSLRVVMRAMLCAPDFLYQPTAPGALSGEALATRLAAFLWKSVPDEPLMQLAREGRLSDHAVLQAQIDRLLDDPRTARFVGDFTDQWLRLDDIDATRPSAKLFPEYDDVLRQAMLEETRAFVLDAMRNNRPVKVLIDADYTFLNRRLAEHYGIPGVDGLTFRKVDLPAGSVRGGLLTQASVLKVTANGTNTSPVPRGNFVLSRLLGIDIPPPPPDAGSVEPDTRGTTTIRETLAAHRDVDRCQRCHVEIDPPGFALEQFDPIGGFRTRYRSTGEGDWSGHRLFGRPVHEYKLGLAVDASGVTAGGSSFNGIKEFKQVLLKEEDAIARHFMHQLIAYATGAEVQFADRATVEAMLEGNRAHGYGMRSLLHVMVQSHLFRSK
jgi:arylsulfatase A